MWCKSRDSIYNAGGWESGEEKYLKNVLVSIAEGTGDTMVLLSYIHTRQLFLFIIPLIFFIMCNFIIDIDHCNTTTTNK